MFKVTTTGTSPQYSGPTPPAGSVRLDDLNARILSHPIVDYDLELEYTLDELLASVDLYNALNLGWLTAEDGSGTPITPGTLTGFSLTDEKVKVSSNDTTSSFLFDKITGTSPISVTELNDGLNEQLQISVSGLSGSNTGDQNLWSTITADSGSTTANTLTDTLTVSGGNLLDTSIVGDTLTVSVNASEFTEAAQDSVGGSLTDTNSVDFTYNDAANTITADVRNDITTGATVAPLSITANGVGVKVDNLTIKHTTGTLAVSDITNVPLGSIDKHSDVDTTTGLPAAGDSLIWNGTNWVPSSAFPANSNNFIFSYDVSTQSVALSPSFSDILFSNNALISGWTHTPGTAIFTAPVSGIYAATAEFIVQKAGTGSPAAAIKCVVNGVDVPGATNGMDLTSNNTAFSISRTFLFNIVAGQTLKIQASASSTTVAITPAPNPTVVPEIRTVTTVASTTPPAAGTLSGVYWTLDTPNGGSYYIWYNTGASVNPAPVGRIGFMVSILPTTSATQVATDTHTLFTTNSVLLNNFVCTQGLGPTSNVLTITNRTGGTTTDTTAGTSGFTVSTTQQGVGTPTPSAALTIRRMT